MNVGRLCMIAFLFALLGASGWFAYDGLTTGNAPGSGHAYIAMGIGIVLSVMVGGGLMFLLFYSSRRGYDEPPTLLDDRRDRP